MAKAAKAFRPVIVTANELRSGAVVFRAPDGRWVTEVGSAEIAEIREAADALNARAQRDADANLVVEPVLIEVERGADGLAPSALRELIRARGPTIALPTV